VSSESLEGTDGDRRWPVGPVGMAPLCVLLALHLGLLAVFDLARHLILVLCLLAAAFAALAWAARRLAAGRTGAVILTGALLLRLTLLPLPLTLSDDVERYLWDGKVAAAGWNPYLFPPASDRLAPLRGQGEPLPPHSDVPTIYPPLAIAWFSIAARLPDPIFAWKAMAAGADLLGCLFLIHLARRLGRPEGTAVWYAWNPLVVLEGAGMGHVDALAIAAAVGTVLLLVGRPRSAGRTALAATAAAAAVLAKLGPLVALPLWARGSGRPIWFLAATAGLVGLALLPVATATGALPPGLAAYGLHWEFNGPLYEPLWRLLDAAGVAPALARGVGHLEHWTRQFDRWDWIYPLLYPRLLAKALLAAGSLAAIALSVVAGGERDAAADTGRLFGRLLLCSATVYPWYVLWMLPWAALAGHRAWLALSGLILLAYLPQHGGPPLWPWIYLAIWGPFGVLLAFDFRRGRGWRGTADAPGAADGTMT
jgi:hypothetical protein